MSDLYHCLKTLLGERLTYRGQPCQVIDILAEEPALVLSSDTGHTIVQSNQYNEPGRRVTETFTVPLLNPRRDGLNPALAELAARYPLADWLSR